MKIYGIVYKGQSRPLAVGLSICCAWNSAETLTGDDSKELVRLGYRLVEFNRYQNTWGHPSRPPAQGDSMIVRLKGKKWTLPEVVQFGDSSLTSPHYTYEVVDYRPPLAGEYYLSGAIPQAYKAPNDLSTPYLIVKQKAKMVRRQGWVPEDATESNGERILKAIATKATERDSVLDPDTATGDEWAAWYKKQYGPIVESEMHARVTLAKKLRCPATWDYILPEVESLIRQ